ncbi:hypothetical protein Vadar_008344 [Vaccinium darrowii]|uniref:Uncharacterized protein n=1 Tax=Vaccinium darrowii TaxID=229202 RepID=A0ACB7XYE0_9ERIC|nr:hypothetical protein Vadar_008344 [Vaccinium darrowii]
MKKSIILLLLFVFTLSSAFLPSQCKHSSGDRTYNVLDFGAAGDGDSDDTQINGTLIAPGPSQWKCKKNKCKEWITFDKLNNLHISGSGTINGQGKKWWGCNGGFVILHSNNVYIRDLAFMDSPQKHIGIDRSKWVYVTNLVITASENSPNTDGIHIQRSQHVFIDHTHIATGDDCISIGDGSAYLNISSITCGPGHGIREEEDTQGTLRSNGSLLMIHNVPLSSINSIVMAIIIVKITNVAGFICITEIDFDRKKITYLAPSVGELPGRFLIIGSLAWLETFYDVMPHCEMLSFSSFLFFMVLPQPLPPLAAQQGSLASGFGVVYVDEKRQRVGNSMTRRIVVSRDDDCLGLATVSLRLRFVLPV